MITMVWVLWALPFYLIGAIPIGYLVSRAYGVDIRSSGSGNVGATNVARVIGKRAGLYTFVGDVLKGVVGVLVARAITNDEWSVAIASIAVVAGHCFSIPPYLKGGKGVATSLGVAGSFTLIGAFIGLGTFAVVAAISKFVSVASIVGVMIVPLYAMAMGLPEYRCLALVMVSSLVILRHRENIVRLIEGKEPRFRAAQEVK